MHPRAEGLDRFVLFAILGIAIVSVGCGGSADSSLPRAPDASSAASVDASASPVDASDAEARSDADAGGIGDSSVDARVDSGSIDGSNASPDAMACSPGIDAGGDCGPSEPAPCDSTHCPAGCCDANGTCQSGGSPAACGAGGAACQTCPAGSECFDCPAGTDCETARFCGCGPESCPSGCCTGGGGGAFGGTCQSGSLATACGSGGAPCADCTSGYDPGYQSNGIPFSTPAGTCSAQQCVYPAPTACFFGCVDAAGHCLPGASDTQCGIYGSDCTDCTASGGECVNQQCCAQEDAGACNEQSCPSGCCDWSGNCQQGLTNVVCGTSGTNCQNCLSIGDVCSDQRCTAQDGGAGCSWRNCNGCCDASGACIAVSSDTQCGLFGASCANCADSGNHCRAGGCMAPDGSVPCGPWSCLGCCDANGACQLGFIDTQCGQNATACQDCTSETPASTCDLSVSPRTCTSEQTTCPATYAGCPAALQELALVPEAACSVTDLQNAAVACADGPESEMCSSIFSAGTACGVCLQPFGDDWATTLGIHACALPFLDTACVHSTACVDDCLTQACQSAPFAGVGLGCVPGDAVQCSLQAQSGTCGSWILADACLTKALDGAAALCNPATYQGNYGAWLAAVGAHYCGP